MYKLKITAQAKKELRLISEQYQKEAINQALLEIKEDPSVGKPLGDELADSYSYKLGVYRIIYTVNEKDKTILVASAGHRGSIYN